ncbi:MAG: hypothetical protein P1U88_00650 [Thalassobaculaceae bacterium]|nr:hypothetical protein [Thalassobaculaceae bacterium]
MMSSLERTSERLWALPRVHVPLPINQIAEFPVLDECLSGWRRMATNGVPSTIDPLEMPVEAIRAISLVDWEETHQRWVVRLASTLMNQGHGQSMSGKPLSDGFSPEEYPGVVTRLEEILGSGEPDLARHEFTDSQRRRWAYVRLVLPLSSDGVKRDRYSVIYDPATFGERIGA